MTFSLPSFAKINWTLRVVGRREDGFHELCTTFQTVSLHDTLHFEMAGEIGLECDDPSLPTDERNLIVKASKVLAESLGIRQGAKILLEKRIPAPGGLGGGSSNAAVTLVGLCKLWGFEPRVEQLQAIGGRVGADVPFFFIGGTAVGTGRGDVIDPLADIGERLMLVVTPDIAMSTADVFGSLAAPTLTNTGPNNNLTVCRKDAESFDPRHSELKNDLEPAVFARYPEVERVKRTLLELGALNAAMSGSGASIFGIFDKQETRQAAIEALATEQSWRKFAVSTMSRQEYRDALYA